MTGDRDGEQAFFEFFNLMLGKQLGYGSSRKVYNLELDKHCVVKVETGPGNFQNIREWDLWNNVKDTVHAKWFAPCKRLSENGQILVMSKTEPPGPNDWPAEIPAFFDDIHKANFGMVQLLDLRTNKEDWHFVCHDYGWNNAVRGGLSKRMQKVDWK
jgi:hypothetical protein